MEEPHNILYLVGDGLELEHLRRVLSRRRITHAASPWPTVGLIILDQAPMRKEEHLDSDRQCQVQHQHKNQQHLACLLVRRAQDRVQVAQQEGYRHSKPNAHKDPVEEADLAPADQGNGYPDEVRVAVQRPALEQVGGFGAKVAESEV